MRTSHVRNEQVDSATEFSDNHDHALRLVALRRGLCACAL